MSYINKIMLIVSSTAQTDLFAQLVTENSFKNYDITVINTDKWTYRESIESKLRQQNLPYRTIEKCRNSNVKKLLHEEKPGIVILGHDRNPVDRLFIRNANSLGIPTLLVQDGILGLRREIKNVQITTWDKLNYIQSISYRFVRYFLRHNQLPWNQRIEEIILWIDARLWEKPESLGHGECRYMAVFGEEARSLLVSEGVDPQRIIVTGNPKFDCIYIYKNISCKQKVCEKWSIPPGRDIILLITEYFVEAKQWSAQQRSDFILTICRAISAFPNVQLIIKLHPPMENEVDYYEIVKDLPNPPIICKYAHLQELLNASAIVMTVHSTVALEAMAMEKPVIIINLFNSKSPLFFQDSGAFFAKNEKEIHLSINKALSDFEDKEKRTKRMVSFVKHHAYLQDGQSSKRIAELIECMINGKKFAIWNSNYSSHK